MMMIRGNNTQKIGGKPPPPVPPRPSKSVVAEALAKTRQNNFKSPTRQAPPPPVSGVNDIVKSKSSFAVNVSLKKPPVFERSISEEIKNSTRTVVYQSSNAKCNSSLNNNINKVQIVKKDSEEVSGVNRMDSFSKISGNNGVQIVRKNSVKRDIDLLETSRKRDSFCEEHVENQHNKKEKSIKRDSFCGAKFVEKIVNIEDENAERDLHEDQNFESSKSNSSTLEKSCDSSTTSSSASSSSDKKNWDQMLNDRNHVNTLIDEMFASVLEVQVNDEENSSESPVTDKTKIVIGSTDSPRESVKINSDEENKVVINNIQPDVVPKTVIVIKNESNENEGKRSSDESRCSSVERGKQVKFKDQLNHELLINELQGMKKDQEKILKRQRKPSMNLYDEDELAQALNEKVRRPDSLDLVNGTEVAEKRWGRLSKDNDRSPSNMSSLQHTLPPLPKSLSGFSITAANHPPTPPRSSSIRSGSTPPSHMMYPSHGGKLPGEIGVSGSVKKPTALDAKLAILRQEMYSLRQLDLSLLSQLWSLNESIQDFRQMLQDQEERVLSPPSPSPTPSSGDEEFYVSATSLNFRPAASSTTRKQSTSSNASSMGG